VAEDAEKAQSGGVGQHTEERRGALHVFK